MENDYNYPPYRMRVLEQSGDSFYVRDLDAELEQKIKDWKERTGPWAPKVRGIDY